MPVNDGQVRYEFELLKSKLARRDRKKYGELVQMNDIPLSGVFALRRGGIEPWERAVPEIAEAAGLSRPS